MCNLLAYEVLHQEALDLKYGGVNIARGIQALYHLHKAHSSMAHSLRVMLGSTEGASSHLC